MKFLLRSLIVFLAAGALYIFAYGALGKYIGYNYPGAVTMYHVLGSILWIAVMGLCFAKWRFTRSETGYSLTLSLAGAPGRKNALSGDLIATYTLVFVLALPTLMYFIIDAPRTAYWAREYRQSEKSLFAAHLKPGDDFDKNATIISFREGALRHDLHTNYRAPDNGAEFTVTPLMHSADAMDTSVRVWLISESPQASLGLPLQFRVIGLLAGSQITDEKKAVAQALQLHGLTAHPEAVLVEAFRHGADKEQTLRHLAKSLHDETSDKLLHWFSIIGGFAFLLGLLAAAAGLIRGGNADRGL